MFASKKGGEITPEHGWKEPSPDWIPSPGDSRSLPLPAGRGQSGCSLPPTLSFFLFCPCKGVGKRLGRLGGWSAEHQGACQSTQIS